METNLLFQTIIYEAQDIDLAIIKISQLKQMLNSSGNIFIIANNIYKNGFIESSFFDFIEIALNNGLKYVNTIVFPIENSKEGLNHNIKYLIWFVQDYNLMTFNKDTIREKHIWKDVEWGKRKKNYNEKGKDPSNVWIPTIDDGKGKITSHIILSIEQIINRCLVSTTQKNDQILIETGYDLNKKDLVGERKIKILTNSFVLNNSSLDNSSLDNSSLDNSSLDNSSLDNSSLDNSSLDNSSLDNSSTADVYFKSSESMKEIKDNSVSLMVTSPPYWDLKNYFKKGQIGQENYEDYLNRLDSIWKETFRVLKLDGSMWININTRTKDKKPILIPNDIIKRCKKIGFKLKDIIIWHKSSGIPTHKNNLVDKYEYFLWFSKTNKINLNINNIKELNDYKNNYLNNGLIWNINRKAGSVGKDFIHPAIYPTELIDRVIKLMTVENDIVIDPFLGSGTSMLSSLKNNRNFIGYEYNEDFLDLMNYRLNEDKLNSKNSINFHFSTGKINKNKIFRKDSIDGN
ncbi:DNA methyltransferase [Aliarcobacter cryaerophilus]|uniref:DNA methyltransferase n=1 Tax=Aliarcobacter cryaerophilus TaxID=28198 RepID=UPI0021B679C9|nr:DNA methyltransferase [Aliarcobacter cryaerophilus]MCT7497628.1 DNA methyltransferase [Aliarcobacter cryaerophilus]